MESCGGCNSSGGLIGIVLTKELFAIQRSVSTYSRVQTPTRIHMQAMWLLSPLLIPPSHSGTTFSTKSLMLSQYTPSRSYFILVGDKFWELQHPWFAKMSPTTTRQLLISRKVVFWKRRPLVRGSDCRDLCPVYVSLRNCGALEHRESTWTYC